MKYKAFFCFLAALVLLLSPLPSLAQPPLSLSTSKTPTVIRVGITNYSKVEEAYKRYESLFKELEDASADNSVTFRFAMGTYGEVIDWYNNNQIDAAFLSALPTAELLLNASPDELRLIQSAYIGNIGQKDGLTQKQQEKGMRLVSELYPGISTAEHGFSFKYRVVGFVRSSDYKQGLRNLSNLRALQAIQDIQGVPKDRLKFLFVKPDSMSGFVIPLKYLREHGINPDESQIEFTGSHQNSIDRLQDKEKDRDKVLVAFVNNSVAYDPQSDFSINKLEGTEGLDNLFAPHLSVLVNHRLQIQNKELFQQYKSLLSKLFKDRIEDETDGSEFEFQRIPAARADQPDDARKSGAQDKTRDNSKRWTEQYNDVRRVLQEALYPQRVLYRSTFDELIADLKNRRARGEPTRLALVLSGGGAKCAYQAGAIQEVENRIQQADTYISVGDFKKTASFFEALRDGEDSPSKFIRERLSGETIKLLDDYHTSSHNNSKLKAMREQAAGSARKDIAKEVRQSDKELDRISGQLRMGLVNDLNNNLIDKASLVDEQAFGGVTALEEVQQLSAPLKNSLLLRLLTGALGAKAEKLTNQQANELEPAAQKEQRRKRLNKLILEKAYPEAIGRLDIELVVGTSGGAINALLAALGMTRDANSQGKISEAWQSFEQGQIFSPPKGLVLFLILSLGLLKCLIIIMGILSFGHRTMTRTVGRNSLIALIVFLAAELFSLYYFDITRFAAWILLIEGLVLGALFIAVRTIPVVNRRFIRILRVVTSPIRVALRWLRGLFRKGEPQPQATAAAAEDEAKEEGNWWLSAAELVLSMSLLLLVLELIITKTYIGESLVFSTQMDWLQHLYVMLSFGLLLSTILPFVLGLLMWGFALLIRHWKPLIVNHHDLAFYSYSLFSRRRRFRNRTQEMETAMPLIKRSSIWDSRARQLIAQVIVATLLFAALLLGMQLFLKEHFPSGEEGIEKAFVKAMRLLDEKLDKSVSTEGGSKEELKRLSQKLISDKLVRDLVITASRLPSSEEEGKNPSSSPAQRVIRVQSDGGSPDGASPSAVTSLVYALLPKNKLRTLTPNELSEDLYFYYRYNRNTNLDIPSDNRFIDLKFSLNTDKLLDVVIGSSSIYPIFPYRVLNNIDVGHEANPKPVREVKIVDGGFIHNIPIEAAVKWKATHILIIEASPESRPFAPQNFMENSEVAFNYLFSQAQRMDDIPRGSVEIYRLRPMSQCEKLNYKPDCANQPPQPNIDTLDFSKIKTGEAFQIGVNDVKGDNPLIARVPGPPVFRTVMRVAPARFETTSRQPAPANRPLRETLASGE